MNHHFRVAVLALGFGLAFSIAAAVMGMELLPHDLGVYAALCAGTAFLLVGHRSVYASPKLGLSKSAGLEVPLDVPVGEVAFGEIRVRKGSLAASVIDELGKGIWRVRPRRPPAH